MNKPFTFLVFILSSILLASCSHSTFYSNKEKDSALSTKVDIPNTFVPQDIAIVSVGDSLTQGVGDSTGKGGYVPYLQNLLEDSKGIKKASFTNYGVRGNRSDQLLNKIKTKEVQRSIREANGVIITIGGNDIMKVVRNNITNLQVNSFNQQLKEYKNNLNQVIQLIKKKNKDAVILLVGVYNPFLKMFSDIKEMNEIVANWNEASQRILSNYKGTYFVNITDIFENSTDELLYKDYFHPNDKGYKLIADAIFKKMENGAIEAIIEEKNVKKE